ncbi:MAG: hypothetical protein IKT40_05980 [Bacilli bacterium]|nr:hypothetical protein [Bacilli bacterium]
MIKTIQQLDFENKLKTDNKNKVFNSLKFKYFLRFENSKIYIYYIGSYCAEVLIMDLKNYTINREHYHEKLVLEHLENYDCFEMIIDRVDFINKFTKFQNEIYKYVKSLSNNANKLMLAEEKVFSPYPRLYKYDENKLIVNDETRNLTLEEYRRYIDNYNSSKIEIWTKKNQEKLKNIDKLAIGFIHVRQQNNKIEYFPRLFGKIMKDTKHKRYSIDTKSIFYGSGLFISYDDNKNRNIDYSYLAILENDGIEHLRRLWNQFIHFIIKNTNNNKIDY